MGIVKSIFSRKKSKQENPEPAVSVIAEGEQSVTKLMMLMPDASGIASYQLHTFVTAKQAEDHLDSFLRGDIQEGTIMFWGLTWTPSDNGNQNIEAEPVVIISDAKRPGLVYTFSFTDIDSAYDFVRHEMKAGLDLARTAIFWAAPAEATANHWGEITVAPSRPPEREPALNGGAPSAAPEPFIAPEPFVAPSHDEPREAERPIDETPSVRLPELVSAESDAVDEPETSDDPEPDAEPERKAVGDLDVMKVINILKARSLRALSSPPPPNDEPDGVEDTADEPSNAGNGIAHAADETVHVDLSDVFGRAGDSEKPATIDDFKSHNGRETNGRHLADENLIQALDRPVSGIVTAWSNIGSAIDEAIDAYVARRVSATISWRRLTRSLAVAVRFRMFVAWRSISRALAAGAAIQAERESAIAEAWRNSARAIYRVAEIKSGRRARRLAWANIAWTLEEAVYAARLRHKRATGRVWFNVASALASAANKKISIQRQIRTACYRLAVGTLDAARTQERHRATAVFAWTSAGKALTDAVEAMHRHERVVLAWANTGIALREYIATKLPHDGLVAAWQRLAAAIVEAADATARHNGIISAWRRLAIQTLIAADLQVKREAAINAWANASEALLIGATEKIRRDGLAAAWQTATDVLHDFANALMRRNGMIAAWHAVAISFGAAIAAKIYRDRCIAIWGAAAIAIADALPLKLRELAVINAWDNAALALSEAAVADAQLLIEQAGLNSQRMKRVKSAIREAASGTGDGPRRPFDSFGSPPGRF